MPLLSLIAARHATGSSAATIRCRGICRKTWKHFKATTLGHPILMGRKTFESIGRPLPGHYLDRHHAQPGLAVSRLHRGHWRGCGIAGGKRP